jgi:DNA-binding transcriptional ArsR family regulator
MQKYRATGLRRLDAAGLMASKAGIGAGRFSAILKGPLQDMDIEKMNTSAARATALLKALANPHRLIILCHLAKGEKSVGDLEELLGMRQPHLSQQLMRLRRDALVETRRDSRTIYYRLKSSAAGQVIRLLYRLYCSRASEAGRVASERAGAGAFSARTRNGRRRAVATASRGMTRSASPGAP